MIWELTWPVARVIETAYKPLEDNNLEDNDDTDDTKDLEDVGNNAEFTILRPTGSFTSFLKGNFGIRVLENSPLEECCPPVAL
jgi:hypothetical protein